jgi:hypothetical protein
VDVSSKMLSITFCRRNLDASSISPFQSSFAFTETALKVFIPIRDQPLVLPDNYTILTGSYPQIIHEKEFNTTGGKMTCTKFVDANGKIYDDWIPAIKLK